MMIEGACAEDALPETAMIAGDEPAAAYAKKSAAYFKYRIFIYYMQDIVQAFIKFCVQPGDLSSAWD